MVSCSISRTHNDLIGGNVKRSTRWLTGLILSLPLVLFGVEDPAQAQEGCFVQQFGFNAGQSWCTTGTWGNGHRVVLSCGSWKVWGPWTGMGGTSYATCPASGQVTGIAVERR